MPNTAVAAIEHLHHSTVKDLDKRYMQQQLARAGTPAPKAIGVDEIAIRKGHTYRIVVSDLERARPIWFGGQGRREEDFDQFFAELGANKTDRLQLAVMDMWRPFRNALERHAPHARIVFDKFHVLRQPPRSTKHWARAFCARGRSAALVAGGPARVPPPAPTLHW